MNGLRLSVALKERLISMRIDLMLKKLVFSNEWVVDCMA